MRHAFNFSRTPKDPGLTARRAVLRAAYDRLAFAQGAPSPMVCEQFPQLEFSPLAGTWASGSLSGADVLIAHADAADGAALDRLVKNLRDSAAAARIIV